jgi:hypothetical protein
MSTLITPHVAGCRWRLTGHTDPAKRVSDAVNNHARAVGLGISWETVQGKYMAFSLNDGRSNGELYDRMGDAVRHTDEMTHFYLRLRAEGMEVCEAELMLMLHRKGRNAGFPQSDPDRKDGGPQIIPRLGTEDVMTQLRGLGG